MWVTASRCGSFSRARISSAVRASAASSGAGWDADARPSTAPATSVAGMAPRTGPAGLRAGLGWAAADLGDIGVSILPTHPSLRGICVNREAHRSLIHHAGRRRREA